MTDAARRAGKLDRITRLSLVQRKCMASHALSVCADAMARKLFEALQEGYEPTDEERAQTEALSATANALKVDNCRKAAFEEVGESINEEEARALNAVIDQWVKDQKRLARFLH
jgi:hypothetical protein